MDDLGVPAYGHRLAPRHFRHKGLLAFGLLLYRTAHYGNDLQPRVILPYYEYRAEPVPFTKEQGRPFPSGTGGVRPAVAPGAFYHCFPERSSRTGRADAPYDGQVHDLLGDRQGEKIKKWFFSMDLLKKTAVFALIVSRCAFACAGEDLVGTTFSQIQCAYLDMDSERTYRAVLRMGFGIIRLGSYWNRIEPSEGVYDFTELDRQLEEAHRKKIPVVLTVGIKAPRWPEYFIPEWLRRKARLARGGDVARNPVLREAALGFIEKVVTRYRDNSAVKYWQVENEALNRIGPDNWYIGPGFLEEEVELVRRLDRSRRPIVLTVATYPNLFLRILRRVGSKYDNIEENLSLCDVLGINVYPDVGHKLWLFPLYFRTDTKRPRKYFRRIHDRIKQAGKVPWVTELQAEPWEPGHLVYTGKEQPRTGRREKTVGTFDMLRSMGFGTVLLWGCEFWLYRARRYGDHRWTESIGALLEMPEKRRQNGTGGE
ncbi:MAG: hypothetical protein GF409_06700 [Candidatus Omnitrophica bacterium]|nr:hypothetical protein [Candidatus Omnitrophota bacterium]